MLNNHIKLWKDTVKNFYYKSGFDAATVLAYTSLFSIVPLLSLLFVLLSQSDLFIQQKEQVMNLIFSLLVPSATPLIEEYLIDFLNHAIELKGFSIAFILISSVLLLITVDSKINMMWDKSANRSFTSSLGHYFGVTLFGPLFIFVSLVLDSIFTTFHHVGGYDFEIYAVAIPFILSYMGFVFLYKFIPIIKPSWAPVLWGALFVSFAIEGLKLLFGLYVEWFPSYNMVYGAISAIPIFLLWLYCLWLIIIFSASLVYQLEQRSQKINNSVIMI